MYVIIMGCGRVGASLATTLAADEHDVVIIDKDPKTFTNLGAAFNGLTVTGTGIDIEVLKRAGIERADAFVAVTSHDNANLMACQIARKIFGVPKVIARINDPRKGYAYEELEVETIFPTDLGARRLHTMILAEGFQLLHTLGAGEVALVRLILPHSLEGRKVAELELPGQLRVAALERGDVSQVPEPGTVLEPGDRVLLSVRRDAMDRLRKLVIEGNRA